MYVCVCVCVCMRACVRGVVCRVVCRGVVCSVCVYCVNYVGMETYICTLGLQYVCNSSTILCVCVHRRRRCTRRPENQPRLLCPSWWRNSTSAVSARAVSQTRNKPVCAATRLKMTLRRYVLRRVLSLVVIIGPSLYLRTYLHVYIRTYVHTVCMYIYLHTHSVYVCSTCMFTHM